MAEPLLLANLPEDAAISDVCRQIVTQSGPIWEQIEKSCKEILAVHENSQPQ